MHIKRELGCEKMQLSPPLRKKNEMIFPTISNSNKNKSQAKPFSKVMTALLNENVSVVILLIHSNSF